ncbi:MAG: hypothetical protein CME64_05480 [Halobacteriovoraceae bacterium]|nr:hypothetical protein [Halobacteriovoraceae bacterium]
MLEINEGIFEEDLLFKMQSNFMDRFCLDQSRASELALEILEMLSLGDTNLKRLCHYYLS